MIRRLLAAVLLIAPLTLFLSATGNPEAHARPMGNRLQLSEHAAGEVLVKFKGVPEATEISAMEDDRPESFEAKLPMQAQLTLRRVQKRLLRVYPKINLAHVQLSPDMSVEEAIDELELCDEIEYAEPNYIVEASALPNDRDFVKQWALFNTGQTGGTPGVDIGATGAWDFEADGSRTIVAVIDTGVDYEHRDLRDNMWKNPREIPNNGIDDDGNGYVDDVHGINAITRSGDPWDDEGHGTHCAGIIGARGNNNVGICGVNYKASVMALKFMDSRGSGTTADAIECIKYALAVKRDNGYTRMVMSNSWGGGGFSRSLYNVMKAAQDAGVLFVAAAGNEGTDMDRIPSYPAAYELENVISVGASDHNDSVANYSNYGQMTVHLFAPGSSIYSTIPGNRYAFLSGTSMATPYVSGAAALLWSKNPGASFSRIKSMLLDYVETREAFAGKCATGGRLNLYNSMYAPLP